MTARDTNSAESENSIFQSTKDGIHRSAHDPELVRIVEHANATAGSTTRRDITVETGWSLDEIDTHLNRLEAAGYVELIGEPDRQIVLLTTRGKWLAREER